MIQYVHGDIFLSPARVITNPVNTVGVMGKGLALQFKNRYPHMYEKYRAACLDKTFDVGKLMLIHETDHDILLFPTKKDWRKPSQLSYIEAGLQKFVSKYEQAHIESIAFTQLGCGLGKLSWHNVEPLMLKYLSELPITIYIYM